MSDVVSAGVDAESMRLFLEPYSRAWAVLREQRLRGDAWPWVRSCMRTRDEDAGAAGLPSENLSMPDKPHLRVFTWAWYAVQRLQVDKSRQLMVTWLCCGLTVHEAMFTGSARVGYQHITGADTAEKLKKYMIYVLERQPLDLMMPWVEERDHPPREWVDRVAAFFGLSLTPPHPPRADQPPYFASDAYHIAKELTKPVPDEQFGRGRGRDRLAPVLRGGRADHRGDCGGARGAEQVAGKHAESGGRGRGVVSPEPEGEREQCEQERGAERASGSGEYGVAG